jgi:hypothetical protein
LACRMRNPRDERATLFEGADYTKPQE